MSRMTYIVRVITSWEFYIIWMYIVLYYEFLTNVHIWGNVPYRGWSSNIRKMGKNLTNERKKEKATDFSTNFLTDDCLFLLRKITILFHFH